jgi:hypothetical protein
MQILLLFKHNLILNSNGSLAASLANILFKSFFIIIILYYKVHFRLIANKEIYSKKAKMLSNYIKGPSDKYN